jgi:hypothetical protein
LGFVSVADVPLTKSVDLTSTKVGWWYGMRSIVTPSTTIYLPQDNHIQWPTKNLNGTFVMQSTVTVTLPVQESTEVGRWYGIKSTVTPSTTIHLSQDYHIQWPTKNLNGTFGMQSAVTVTLHVQDSTEVGRRYGIKSTVTPSTAIYLSQNYHIQWPMKNLNGTFGMQSAVTVTLPVQELVIVGGKGSFYLMLDYSLANIHEWELHNRQPYAPHQGPL